MDLLASSIVHYHPMQRMCSDKIYFYPYVNFFYPCVKSYRSAIPLKWQCLTLYALRFQDVLHHILSLVPLRDAARAACVSRNFLCSWRRFPNLTFNWETLGVNLDDAPLRESAKELVNRINCILENHSGTGVKTLKLQVSLCGGVITANLLDIWLQASVKSGIVELHLDLPRINSLPFNLSCSLISSAASSLHSLSLTFCAFHPTPTIGLRNLKNVRLALVHITEEELGCLFSCTTSLEKFEVFWCHDFTSLKIPSHLQKLSFLRVFLCRRLQMIEINAPNVSTFMFRGPPMKISIINSSQLKRVAMDGQFYSGMFQYALTKLQSITSNLQALTLFSTTEVCSFIYSNMFLSSFIFNYNYIYNKCTLELNLSLSIFRPSTCRCHLTNSSTSGI